MKSKLNWTNISYTKRVVCLFLAINLLFEVVSPSLMLALTSGPAQEEFSSFEPSTTTDMVDLYTGDFNYNIPLMSVPGPNGGYPLNLAYHSGVGMEQEASWVGLGWSLNVGSVNRQLRGIPDDFNGELVKKRQHMKESWTVALDIPTRAYREMYGIPTGSPFQHHFQIYYNNYRGMGYRYLPSFSFPNKGNSEGGPIGLNASFDSQNGLDMELDFSVNRALGNSAWKAGFKAGLNYNSLQGLQGFSFASNLGRSTNITNKWFRMIKADQMANNMLGSSLSYAVNGNVPETRMQTKTTTVPFNLKIAKPSKMFLPWNFPAKFPMLWSGYVNKTKMVNNGKRDINAYGYINDLSSITDDVMRDFNRDNLQYSKKVPNLPMSSFTYDIFNQTGQGTGSNFRAYQNQIHLLRDPETVSNESSYDAELEFGMGPGLPVILNTSNVHIGLAFNYGSGQSRSGYWKQIKNVADVDANIAALKTAPIFPNNTAGYVQSKIYENIYFKAHGEKTGFYSSAATEDQLAAYGNEDAIRFEIEKEKNDASFLNRHYKVNANLIKKEGQSASSTIQARPFINSFSRAKRANNIEYLTEADAATFGYSRNDKYYNSAGTLVSKFPSGRAGNKLSEISILQADGMRYVYGMATYNNKQVDNVFSSKAGGTFNTNTVSITPGSIEGIDIKGTFEEYMERNELPDYANGWLLTAIYSADYLDLTNDGPTDDDYGFWIKFNYSKIHSDYKWRSPYSGANFMEGNRNDPSDDKGSYTYGEKEIYFIHSVESKTHLAKFITSNRRDGIEAPGELNNSGLGTKALKKLDKIQLFAKKDLAVNGASAKPIKAVNFVYSYELCPGVYNNNGAADVTNDYYDENGNFVSGATNINTGTGKLTLKQVYFTYQNSTRSQLSPYIFKYGTGAQNNPAYERRNMDRWGNYVNNTIMYPGGSNPYAYIDNPYTPQDPFYYDTANPNRLVAGQWSLKQILLPTGGTINVDYDFDDYYYEEQEKATRMYDITGCLNHQTSASRSGNNVDDVEQQKIYFNLEEPVANVTEFYDKYIARLPKNQVYYRVYAEIKGTFATANDYVSGYAEIDNSSGAYGINPAGTVGYIKLKKVPLSKLNAGGTMISPISRAIIEHTRANRSELLHNAVPYATTAKAQILNVLGSVVSAFGSLMQAAQGFNRWAHMNLYNGVYQIKLNGNSMIRLCDPDEKIGGGIRVKKLTMVDNWKNGTTNDISTYGQEYDYTTKDANGNTISSGIAYEPHLGSEESALSTAIKFPSSSLFKSNYDMMVETPIAKSHYPGESVGYSKVTVKSIGAQELYNANGQTNLPKNNSAPVSVYEFYTQRDFPVIVKETDNGPYSRPININIPVLGLFTTVKRRQAKSQGYTVILNDMAGKPKSTAVYTVKLSSDASGKVTIVPDNLISKQNFIYSTKQAYNPNAVNELDNNIQTIGINTAYQTTYQTAVLGQTHDMYVDMNENSQEHTSFGATGNLDVAFFAPIVPFFVPIPWVIPSYHKTTNSMRTVVFNKIIHRTGILTKVETTTDKSTIVTENLAFDIETGQPLLTKVTNEFKDPIYNFSFPGHWYYKNLGPAYRNFAMKFTAPHVSASNASGVIPVSFGSSFFTKGDIVYINSANAAASGLYHVYTLSGASISNIHCVDKNGNYYPPNTGVNSIQIVRSGYRNQQNVQVGGLGFKSLKNTGTGPDFVAYQAGNASTLKTSATSVTFDNANDNKIINASATELSDDWQMQCGENTQLTGNTYVTCTPLTGALGESQLYTFLNNLVSTNQLFTKNVLLVQNNNPSGSLLTTGNLAFNNGFNNVLLNLFNGYNQLINPNSPSLSNGLNLYYSGFISSTSKNYVIVITNFQIPNSITNPGQLFGTYYSTWPLPGLKFKMPVATAPLVSNPQQFWTSFITSNPTTTSSFPGNLSNGNACFFAGPNYLVNIPGYGNQSIIATCNVADSYNGGFYYLTCIAPSCLNSSGQVCTYGTPVTPLTCGTQTNQVVNPYQIGMKGNWRPKRTYSYNTDRTQNDNVREDGVLTSFMRFPWENTVTKDPKWIEAATVTKYNQQGFEIENRNAIGNFSGALYGYGNSLSTAVANNARYTDIAFDGFEDYPKSCDEDHLGFSQHSAQVISGGHTGKYAIQVNTSLTVVRDVFTNCDNYSVNGQQYVNDNPASINTSGGNSVAHVVKPCDCIGKFNPQLNKKYVFSAWVSENLGGNAGANAPYAGFGSTVKIDFISAANAIIGSQIITTSGGIIDGWQRLYGEFTLPTGTVRAQISLVKAGSGVCRFDDIKIQPFESSMKAFVYDALTSKVLAELDDNNYATIYNYDDEGNLIKVKRETEKGIKTVKEGRINSKKLAN